MTWITLVGTTVKQILRRAKRGTYGCVAYVLITNEILSHSHLFREPGEPWTGLAYLCACQRCEPNFKIEESLN